MKKDKLLSWVVAGNNEFICEHCGAVYKLQMPMSIDVFTKKSKAFCVLHEDCSEPAQPLPCRHVDYHHSAVTDGPDSLMIRKICHNPKCGADLGPAT